MPKKETRRFVVVGGTSTRLSTDHTSPDYEEWVDFRAGDEVSEEDVPDHAPISAWVRSGHWKVAK